MPFPENGSLSQPFAPRRRPTLAEEKAARERGLGSDSYQGYGFEFPPGSSCAPGPVDSLTQCIRALGRILDAATSRVQPAPWIHPTFRGRSFNEHTRSILSVTAAVDPVVQAAGVAMKAANETVPGWTVPLLEMASAGDYKTIFTLAPQQAQAVRIKSWGISTGASLPETVVVRVKATGTGGGQPSSPNPFLSSYQVDRQQDVFFLVKPNQTLEIQVGLRGFTAPEPVLIDFGISGWVFPDNMAADSQSGTGLRSGYGVDCP